MHEVVHASLWTSHSAETNIVAGLDSDEEDEEAAADEQEETEIPELGGRIKRKKIAETAEPSPASDRGNTKNLLADSDDEYPAAAQAASGNPTNVTRRQRNAQLFGDSDDE